MNDQIEPEITRLRREQAEVARTIRGNYRHFEGVDEAATVTSPPDRAAELELRRGIDHLLNDDFRQHLAELDLATQSELIEDVLGDLEKTPMWAAQVLHSRSEIVGRILAPRPPLLEGQEVRVLKGILALIDIADGLSGTR